MNDQPQVGQSPVAPTVAPAAVQPNQPQGQQPDKQVFAYQELQSKHDKVVNELQTLEEYKSNYPRVVDQNAKLKATVAQYETKEKINAFVEANPHLASLAKLQNFNGMTDEQINAWGKSATEFLNSNAVSTTPQAPNGPQAPNVQSAAAPTGSAMILDINAFNALPIDKQKDYLRSIGQV